MTDMPKILSGRSALVAGPGAAADAVASALERLGAAVMREPAPSADAEGIATSFDAATDGIDVLVHAGAFMQEEQADAVSLDLWRGEFSEDIDGRFLHAAEFARRRIADHARGAVLFLMPSPAVSPGRAAILSAHGALDNLVKSLSAEWGRDGIRINAIASRVVEDFDAASESEQASLGNLAAYILSDHGAYITGMVMGVNELS